MRNLSTILGLAAVVAAAVVGTGSTPLGAQPGPRVSPATLTVSPLRVDPGKTITFTVANCSVQPQVGALEYDAVFPIEMVAGSSPGEWHGQMEARGIDLFVSGTCGDQDLGNVRVDVDNPMIGFHPIGSMIAPDGTPSRVYGSDCPDGTVARIRYDEHVLGQPTATGETWTAPIDSRGDWDVSTPVYAMYAVVPPPGTPAGTVLREFTVHASCGQVTYEVLHIVVQRAVGDDPLVDPPQADVPPPTTPAVPPTAPPANAVSGTSHYAG